MVAVTGDDHRFGSVEEHLAVRGGGGGVGARIGGENGEVDGRALRRPGLVEPGQQQQVLDQAVHAGRLLFDPAHHRGLVHLIGDGAEPEELGEPLDRGQWRPELVGGISEELAKLLLGLGPGAEGLLDLVEHGVEGQAELTDLGATVGRARPVGRDRHR